MIGIIIIISSNILYMKGVLIGYLYVNSALDLCLDIILLVILMYHMEDLDIILNVLNVK